jgi:hypothetical protein
LWFRLTASNATMEAPARAKMAKIFPVGTLATLAQFVPAEEEHVEFRLAAAIALLE